MKLTIPILLFALPLLVSGQPRPNPADWRLSVNPREIDVVRGTPIIVRAECEYKGEQRGWLTLSGLGIFQWEVFKVNGSARVAAPKSSVALREWNVSRIYAFSGRVVQTGYAHEQSLRNHPVL